jgi:predicted membrane channel-forming protein YqfA (hemolysin III family)
VILIIYIFNRYPAGHNWFVAAFSILYIVGVILYFMKPCPEGFYFEVSPRRKRCLEEQVSTDRPPNRPRSRSCCQKGTVGGIVPVYRDWLEPRPVTQDWQRTDNWTTVPSRAGLIPPTELVGGDKNRKVVRRGV